jgi:hypothetical protein
MCGFPRLSRPEGRYGLRMIFRVSLSACLFALWLPAQVLAQPTALSPSPVTPGAPAVKRSFTGVSSATVKRLVHTGIPISTGTRAPKRADGLAVETQPQDSAAQDRAKPRVAGVYLGAAGLGGGTPRLTLTVKF